MNFYLYYLQLPNMHMNTNTHSHTHTPQRSEGNAVFKYQGYENYFNFKSVVSSLISHTKKLLAKNKTKQKKRLALLSVK